MINTALQYMTCKWSDLVIKCVVKEKDLLPVSYADDKIQSAFGD